MSQYLNLRIKIVPYDDEYMDVAQKMILLYEYHHGRRIDPKLELELFRTNDASEVLINYDSKSPSIDSINRFYEG